MLAKKKRCQDRIHEVQPCYLVGSYAWNIIWLAIAQLKETRKPGGRLNDIIVGRPAGIASITAEADGGGLSGVQLSRDAAERERVRQLV